MEAGTPGTWDGEKWIPLDHEQLRTMVVDILIRDVSPVLELPRVREIVRDELASHMAAALADPDIGDHAVRALLDHTAETGQHPPAGATIVVRAASKGLAAYLLERLSSDGGG